MKKYFMFAALILMSFLSGCALFGVKAKVEAKVASPTVYIDGKAVEAGQKIAGDFNAKTESGKIMLSKFNFWSFVGGFGIWFFIGGAFMLTAIIAAIWFKAYKTALAAFASGGIVLLGAYFLKLFWVALAWITGLLVVAVLAFALIHYRKVILSKAKEFITEEHKENK